MEGRRRTAGRERNGSRTIATTRPLSNRCNDPRNASQGGDRSRIEPEKTQYVALSFENCKLPNPVS